VVEDHTGLLPTERGYGYWRDTALLHDQGTSNTTLIIIIIIIITSIIITVPTNTINTATLITSIIITSTIIINTATLLLLLLLLLKAARLAAIEAGTESPTNCDMPEELEANSKYGFLNKLKLWLVWVLRTHGFYGVLLMASYPNIGKTHKKTQKTP
jgi:hypothetical protein